ncbi:MAG: NAD(P)H-hydrate dehydratase, partial [Sediminibacterium sp.]|nr:NAD(P)H-hydrate dehydratase [Sediminibacterium sp.]
EYTLQQQANSDELLLMQAAATAFNRRWLPLNKKVKQCFIFCGPGKNGGDGYCIALQLLKWGVRPIIYQLITDKQPSDLIKKLKKSFQQAGGEWKAIKKEKDFPRLDVYAPVIDALFGVGLNRPLCPVTAALVNHINKAFTLVWSVDIPSGMGAETFIPGPIIKATVTISFETPKAAFFLAQNATAFGKCKIVSIGLNTDYPKQHITQLQVLQHSYIQSIFHPRQAHQHKGNFGNAFMIAGSRGKMGAAILASRACLQSGVGLLTSYIPEPYANSMHSDLPEAMIHFREQGLPDMQPYKAIGIGPGMGTDEASAACLRSIFEQTKIPLVIDADAITILSNLPDGISLIPPDAILTPHPKEFDRLFGAQENEYERTARAIALTESNPWLIILKGRYTLICYRGKGWYNTRGNVGLAKGGSGDMLTGILTALLAQGYSLLHAAQLGVYIHATAADIAIKASSYESLLASEVISFLGAAFKSLYRTEDIP